jgi:glycosyltransferase involved in cell wall biosynthesis
VNRPTIAAGVITRNERRHIVSCLESLQWADEIVVLDSQSDDGTVELARPLVTRLETRRFVDFPSQRQAALDLICSDWVLFVDADERVTSELAEEVRDVVALVGPSAPVGYWVPRRNYIWGRWIKGGGWYPDYQLRLFRRNRGRYDLARGVHELVDLDGAAGHLQHTLIHHNYESVGQFLAKQWQYSTLEARTLFDQGKRARPHNLVLQPVREFRRRLVTLGGYRDGPHGVALATLLAYYTLVTYVKLWRLHARG